MGERGFESERVDTARMREREALSGLEMVNWGFVSHYSNLIHPFTKRLVRSCENFLPALA